MISIISWPICVPSRQTLDRPPALVGASLGGMTSLVAIAESNTPLAGALGDG